ncbi:MAG: hypothetical protein A3K19_06440 [Lentisphaerae bacterium RIFOXYB12_FULL_65_16]|nr:MAG: hypothetical protein A3K18_09995 [Lentisphaerae bacterium RIFOXYA12_64_32]OGV93820.1 MAG: hypothetical protein A3K19_06440 [Lentisphaerae bacterium RIFOXYB12_FULL_65_16]
MAEARVLVATTDEVVQVRVLGRATFKVSQELRDFGVRTVKGGAKRFILDLSECQGMDSTFLGVLAMIGLAGRNQAQFVVVNAAPSIKDLMGGVGLSKLWAYADKPVAPVTWSGLCEAAEGAVSVAGMAGLVLEAHRSLMDLDPQNVPKFRDVVELLTAELARTGGPAVASNGSK